MLFGDANDEVKKRGDNSYEPLTWRKGLR